MLSYEFSEKKNLLINIYAMCVPILAVIPLSGVSKALVILMLYKLRLKLLMAASLTSTLLRLLLLMV